MIKLPTAAAVPPIVVTETAPLNDPGITMASNVLPSFETGIAETPPKLTVVKLSK